MRLVGTKGAESQSPDAYRTVANTNGDGEPVMEVGTEESVVSLAMYLADAKLPGVLPLTPRIFNILNAFQAGYGSLDPCVARIQEVGDCVQVAESKSFGISV